MAFLQHIIARLLGVRPTEIPDVGQDIDLSLDERRGYGFLAFEAKLNSMRSKHRTLPAARRAMRIPSANASTRTPADRSRILWLAANNS